MWKFSEAEGDEETAKTSILSVATATKRAKRATSLVGGDDVAEVSEDDHGRPAAVTSRSGATRRVKKDREIFTLSLTAPPLHLLSGPTEAPPKASTLEDALREASELQIENSVTTPISATDFLSIRHRSPNIQKTTQPAEKRRRVV